MTAVPKISKSASGNKSPYIHQDTVFTHKNGNFQESIHLLIAIMSAYNKKNIAQKKRASDFQLKVKIINMIFIPYTISLQRCIFNQAPLKNKQLHP